MIISKNIAFLYGMWFYALLTSTYTMLGMIDLDGLSQLVTTGFLLFLSFGAFLLLGQVPKIFYGMSCMALLNGLLGVFGLLTLTAGLQMFFALTLSLSILLIELYRGYVR